MIIEQATLLRKLFQRFLISCPAPYFFLLQGLHNYTSHWHWCFQAPKDWLLSCTICQTVHNVNLISYKGQYALKMLVTDSPLYITKDWSSYSPSFYLLLLLQHERISVCLKNGSVLSDLFLPLRLTVTPILPNSGTVKWHWNASSISVNVYISDCFSQHT